MTPFSLTHWQQTDRSLVLTTLLGPDRLLAERMVLRESLLGVAPDCLPQLSLQSHADWGALESQGVDAVTRAWLTAEAGRPPRAGYCLHLTALSDNVHIDLVALIGQPLLLEWQTDADRASRRPLHGHITAAQLLAVNGGFARYGLIVEPALAWLAQRRDSWVFQGKNVLDIVHEVIAETAGAGALSVREAIENREAYLQQSQLTQAHQSDLDFVHDLLLANGLTYLFEHEADPTGATLGRHTLVITDQHTIGTQLGELRFHRGDATESSDTIQHWQPQHQIAPLAYSAQSWDYATLDTRPVTVNHAPALSQDNELAAITALLTVEDDPGQYSWFDSADGARYATMAQQASDARMQTWMGAGTVRSLAPGAQFSLVDRTGSWGSFDTPAGGPDAPDDHSVRVLAVTHSARNNFDAEFSARLVQALGGGMQQGEGSAPGQSSGNASPTPLYANSFSVVPAAIVWRPIAAAGPSDSPDIPGLPAPLHASPAPIWSVPASAVRCMGVARANRAGHPRAQPCTAIVVGQAGSPLDTDRNHRVKIQYHWQRGMAAHNWQSHPSGDTNAPANETSGTWARIGTPLAGDNYGAVWIPRIGQEVVVEFAHGDPDRPVIVGTVYNGQGTADQTGNTQPGGVGAATGNAPLWFNGNGHANHLSGIVTQTLSDSQSGAAQRYSQFVLDDTPQQSRLEIFTTQAETQLQLGHHRHQVHNERRADLGHGLTVSTQQYGALRAGSGLLLSADGKSDTASTLDSAEPLAQLAQAESLVASLAQSAHDHEARLAGEPAPDQLPATWQLKHSQDVLGTTQSATAVTPDAESAIRQTAGGGGTVAAWSEPALVLSAPDGIASVTPQSQHLFANGQLTEVAQDIEQGAQGNLRHVGHGGAVLYTYGKANDSGKVVTTTGIRLHAATGQTHLQAHSGKIDLHADKTVTMSSHTQISADTPTRILLAAGGSAITIQGGQIVLQSAGSINLMGNPKSHTSPASAGANVAGLGKGKMQGCAQQQVKGLDAITEF